PRRQGPPGPAPAPPPAPLPQSASPGSTRAAPPRAPPRRLPATALRRPCGRPPPSPDFRSQPGRASAPSRLSRFRIPSQEDRHLVPVHPVDATGELRRQPLVVLGRLAHLPEDVDRPPKAEDQVAVVDACGARRFGEGGALAPRPGGRR